MSGDYPATRAEFMAALRADERSLAEDKKHVAAMAPKWRAERQQRADAAFEQWKRDRKEREARLSTKLNGEEGFPTPAEHVRRLSL
jgi:hypothetical protein